MLKSSNMESIINAVGEATFNEANSSSSTLSGLDVLPEAPLPLDNSSFDSLKRQQVAGSEPQLTSSTSQAAVAGTAASSSLAVRQLSKGILEIYEPPLAKARSHLKELITKQNRIWIDLSAEKFKLDSAEITKVNEMMNDVKVYREKLLKIKKDMRSIHLRSEEMKKRASYIQSCKQKELQRRLLKQQQEEALIAKQSGNT